MKKYSYILLSLVLGNTAFDSHAIKFNNESTENEAYAAAQLPHIAGTLSAISVKNGALIAPRLFIASGNVTPFDTEHQIHFTDAAGNVVHIAKVIDQVVCPGMNRIGHGNEAHWDPATNFVIYVLDKPVNGIKPLPLSVTAKADLLYDAESKLVGVAKLPTSGAKGFYTIKLSQEASADNVLLGDCHPANCFSLEHKDSASPVLKNEDNMLKLVGLWSSSPNAGAQANKLTFTLLSAHAEFINAQIAKYAPLSLSLAPEAAKGKAYSVYAIQKGECYTKLGLAKPAWFYGPRKLDPSLLPAGVHSFIAAPSGKKREEVVIVDSNFTGYAVKIDNSGTQVRLTLKDQKLVLTIDGQVNEISGNQSFDVPYGQLNMSLTVPGKEPIQFVYNHNEN